MTPSLRPSREVNLFLLVLFPIWHRELGLSGASTDIFFQEKRISGDSLPARVLTVNDPERYKEQQPRAAATATNSPGQARAPSVQSYFATPPNEIFCLPCEAKCAALLQGKITSDNLGETATSLQIP